MADLAGDAGAVDLPIDVIDHPDPERPAEPAATVVLLRDGPDEVEVLDRRALSSGRTVAGPAIVEDLGATVRVLRHQRLVVRPSGVLELRDD